MGKRREPTLLEIATGRAKTRSPSRDLEHHEQVMLIEWCRLSEKIHPELARIFAIPNFSGRLGKVPPVAAIRQAQRLKAEGRRPGVPDLMLPVARGGFHGLFIEMKSPEGVLSQEQQDEITDLKINGYAVAVCRSFTAARDVILMYLEKKPT